MKRLLLAGFAFSLLGLVQAQFSGMSVETYQVHDGMVGDADLTGMTTYRVYANFTNATDELSAVYGDAANPLSISTSTTFFQTTFGASIGSAINLAFFPMFPSVEYDSWVTIGISSQPVDDQVEVNQAGLDDELALFEEGLDLLVNDAVGGSWFALPAEANGAAGDDLKVLIAQLTTSGVITGNVNLQIFVGGNQANEETAVGEGFSSLPDVVFGCTNVDATNYDMDATSDDGSCTYPCALLLTEDETTSTSCSNSNDGTVIVSASGEQFGIQFSIDGGDDYQAIGSFGSLLGGTYTITAIDGAGCSSEIEVTVASPAEVIVDAVLDEAISCNGMDDAVIGGVATGGTGTLVFSLSEDLEGATSELNFIDLGPGLYTVYSEDENGCAGQSVAVTVSQPFVINVFVTGGPWDASCSDSDDGALVVVATGGSGTIEYSLDGENFGAATTLYAGAGDYTVYAQDVNGCMGMTSENFTIGAPDAIEISTDATSTVCAGGATGSIVLGATGGNGDFTYAFAGGAGSDQVEFFDLLAGTYEVLVTDANGCTALTMATVEDAAGIEATASSASVSCNGLMNGEIIASATGGEGTFVFSLDGMNYDTNVVFGDLAGGDYTVYILDGNQCESMVEVSIFEPEAISVDAVVTNDSGAGDGSIDITVNGGNGGDLIIWTGPNDFTANTEDIGGLGDGDYTVTVTDVNGCTVSETFSVTVGVTEMTTTWSLAVSPNPSTGSFNLSLEGMAGEGVSLDIVDLQGRLVLSEFMAQQWGASSRVLDLSGLADGMYALRLTVGDEQRTLQLVKQQ
jgi:hypothetical protein